MFSLGGGGRANEITQGGHADGTNTPTRLRRSSFGSEDQWDDTGVPFRDDTLAPSVSARFRAPGEQTTGEFAANDNVFALGLGMKFPSLSREFPRIPLLSSVFRGIRYFCTGGK